MNMCIYMCTYMCACAYVGRERTNRLHHSNSKHNHLFSGLSLSLGTSAAGMDSSKPFSTQLQSLKEKKTPPMILAMFSTSTMRECNNLTNKKITATETAFSCSLGNKHANLSSLHRHARLIITHSPHCSGQNVKPPLQILPTIPSLSAYRPLLNTAYN